MARSRAVIHLVGGRRVTEPMATGSPKEDTAIARMVYSFQDRTLVITTSNGANATVEIESSIGTARVVYLDQGHWSALARRIDDPGSFSNQEDASSADKIIGWARDRHIILPLSSGHVMETTPLYGPKRQSLALTMLQLSRGWHMRNPVQVRRDEITRVIGGTAAIPLGHGRPDVFTLDADSLYATSSLPQPRPGSLPDYLDWLSGRLTAVTANLDLLIDPQRANDTSFKLRLLPSVD